jgi:mannose-1-phosphate guanylyltransferase
MRAMILAAGLGTRLRPLTHVRPKALVPVMGSTPLEFWIFRLHRLGFEAVVVNAFQMPERLVEAVRKRNWPIPVHLEVEPELLGTGGGIRNVLDFFQGRPFVAVNGDTLCDAPLGALLARHLQSGTPASLLMHDWTPFNHVAVDDRGAIVGFGEEAAARRRGDSGMRLLAFTGIHFLNPDILQAFPVGQPMDILTVYRELIAEGSPPHALLHGDLFWREMGEIDSYWALNKELCTLPAGFLPPLVTGARAYIHPQASLAPDAKVTGCLVLGAGSRVLAGAELEDAILWDRVTVREGSVLRHCIVTDDAVVSGCHENAILRR